MSDTWLGMFLCSTKILINGFPLKALLMKFLRIYHGLTWVSCWSICYCTLLSICKWVLVIFLDYVFGIVVLTILLDKIAHDIFTWGFLPWLLFPVMKNDIFTRGFLPWFLFPMVIICMICWFTNLMGSFDSCTVTLKLAVIYLLTN